VTAATVSLTGHAAPYLAAVLAALDCGVILSDGAGRVIHVGAQLADLLGPVPPAAVGLRRDEVLRRCADHVDDGAAFLRAAGLESMRPAPGAFAIDLVIRSRIVRWTSTRIALPDGDGRLDLFRDVTLEDRGRRDTVPAR